MPMSFPVAEAKGDKSRPYKDKDYKVVAFLVCPLYAGRFRLQRALKAYRRMEGQRIVRILSFDHF